MKFKDRYLAIYLWINSWASILIDREGHRDVNWVKAGKGGRNYELALLSYVAWSQTPIAIASFNFGSDATIFSFNASYLYIITYKQWQWQPSNPPPEEQISTPPPPHTLQEKKAQRKRTHKRKPLQFEDHGAWALSRGEPHPPPPPPTLRSPSSWISETTLFSGAAALARLLNPTLRIRRQERRAMALRMTGGGARWRKVRGSTRFAAIGPRRGGAVWLLRFGLLFGMEFWVIWIDCFFGSDLGWRFD